MSADTTVTDQPGLVSTSLLTSSIQGGGEGHIVSSPHTKSLRDERLIILSLFSRGIARLTLSQSLATSAIRKAIS